MKCLLWSDGYSEIWSNDFSEIIHPSEDDTTLKNNKYNFFNRVTILKNNKYHFSNRDNFVIINLSNHENKPDMNYDYDTCVKFVELVKPKCWNMSTATYGGECQSGDCIHHSKTEPICGIS
jgi:hypothetical protein